MGWLQKWTGVDTLLRSGGAKATSGFPANARFDRAFFALSVLVSQR